MATITATATYADNLQVELRDVLCFEFDYQDTIDGQPNPQSKQQFLQQKFNEFLRTWVKNTYLQGKKRQQVTPDIIIE